MTENVRFSFRQVLMEMVLWMAFPAAFLAIYMARYHAPVQAAAAHILIIAMFAAIVASLRYCLHRWTTTRIALLGGAWASGTVLWLLCCYYFSVIVGLDGWGRVISSALIRTYLAQAPYLLETLGLRPAVVAAVLLLSYLTMLALVHAFYRRWDWTRMAARRGSRGISLAAPGLVLIAAVLAIYRMYEFPDPRTGEPLMLTMHPLSAENRLQSHYRSTSVRLEAMERAEREAYRPGPATARGNVFLIVVDALRADHLSVNGYPRQTSPYLAELEKSGRLQNFSKAFSVCSESACGLMGISSSRNIHRFIARPITLQETLRRHGYGIHMILAGDHTNFYGLRESYGKVDSFFDSSMTGDFYINDDYGLLDRLDRFPIFSGQPTFIQFHLMSTHSLGKRDATLPRFEPSVSFYASLSKNVGRAFTAEEKQTFVNHYDNGVITTDHIIRTLLGKLGSKGYLNDALVVITADHGEHIGEQDRYGHAHGVAGEVLNIPLMVIGYGKHQGLALPDIKSRIVSQVDIAPTILEQLGIESPRTWSGTPLQKRTPGSRHVFFQQKGEFGLIESNEASSLWKFRIDAGSGREFAYDLVADPAETNNRAAEVGAETKAGWRRLLIDLDINARETAGVQ